MLYKYNLWSRIYIVERIRISYFLALSHVARFYATTEQKFIHSFWNALRIRRKINQLHQSLCYTLSIYYTSQTILGFADIGSMEKFFWFFSVSPLIHVKKKKITVEFHTSKNILKMIKQRNQSCKFCSIYRIHIYALWYVDFM